MMLTVCGIGFGGALFFSLVALSHAPSGWWREMAGKLLLTQLVLSGAALLLVLILRSHFRALSWRMQRLLGIAMLVMVATLMILTLANFDA